MLPSIQLPPQYLLLVIKSISSTRSDTNMLPIRIAPKKGIIGYEVNVHVTQRTTLVRNPFLLTYVANHGVHNSDFDGVSCLNKYVKFIHTWIVQLALGVSVTTKINEWRVRTVWQHVTIIFVPVLVCQLYSDYKGRLTYELCMRRNSRATNREPKIDTG